MGIKTNPKNVEEKMSIGVQIFLRLVTGIFKNPLELKTNTKLKDFSGYPGLEPSDSLFVLFLDSLIVSFVFLFCLDSHRCLKISGAGYRSFKKSLEFQQIF